MENILDVTGTSKASCDTLDDRIRFGERRMRGMASRGDQTGKVEAVVVRAYVEQGLHSGGIDPTRTLNILDLAPGCGERAWRVLKALEGVITPAVRYFALCDSPEQAGLLAVHPLLQPDCIAFRFEPIIGQQALLDALGIQDTPENPHVILAHGAFGHLRHDLFACHYGTALEAWVPREGALEKASIEWRNVSSYPAEPSVEACASGLLPRYLETVNSAAFLVPTGALKLLQALAEINHGRYLLLASDVGTGSAAQIRMGALTPSRDMLSEADCLPVNFHAIAHWHARQGASATTTETAGSAYYIALQDSRCSRLAQCLPVLESARASRACTQKELPAVAAALCNSLQPEHAFTLFRASNDSPQVLLTLAPVLARAAPTVQADALSVWRGALQNAYEQYFPAAEDEGFFRALAHLAMGLDTWGLATAALERSAHLYGATLQDLAMLARCHETTGDCVSALAFLKLALLEFPDQEALIAECERVEQRLARRKNRDGHSPGLSESGPLRIEPLEPEHAAAFLYQYRDPQIGMMTRLPEFEDVDGVAAWIVDRSADPGRSEFAVMHREYGFVGVVSAHRVDECAFFHFWIGVDFQGLGFAEYAFELLRTQLSRSGVARIFTAVYPDNCRSLRTLRRAGFIALNERALPPEDGMEFFCLEPGGECSPVRDLQCALRDYCARSGGSFTF